MRRSLRSVVAVALVVLMQTSSLAKPQRVTSFTGLAKGQGTLTRNGETFKVTGVWVHLKENGEADITLYTNLQLFVQGQWSASEDPSKGISLKITGGIVDANANGMGTLFLRRDRESRGESPGGESIDKLSFQVKAGSNKTVTVEFFAEKEKSSG